MKPRDRIQTAGTLLPDWGWQRAHRWAYRRSPHARAVQEEWRVRHPTLAAKLGTLSEVPGHLVGTGALANLRLAASIAALEWSGPVWLVGARLELGGGGPWQLRMRLPEKRWRWVFGFEGAAFSGISMDTCPEWYVACRATAVAMVGSYPDLEGVDFEVWPMSEWKRYQAEPRLRLADGIPRRGYDIDGIGLSAREAKRIARAEGHAVEWQEKAARLRAQVLSRAAERRAAWERR